MYIYIFRVDACFLDEIICPPPHPKEDQRKAHYFKLIYEDNIDCVLDR